MKIHLFLILSFLSETAVLAAAVLQIIVVVFACFYSAVLLVGFIQYGTFLCMYEYSPGFSLESHEPKKNCEAHSSEA